MESYKVMKNLNKFFFPGELLDFSYRNKLPAAITPIKMSETESAFLTALLEQEKPKNVLELGVFAGGTTCLIMEVLSKVSPNAHLTSVDLYDNWFDDPSKKTGFLCKSSSAPISWELITGKYLPELASEFTPFDFVILDTVHFVPGELLDILVILKMVQDKAIVVLHDINLFATGFAWQQNAFATKLVYDAVVGEKINVLIPNSLEPANIGAFIVTEDTLKYIINLFLLFSFRWEYIISKEEFNIYHKFYELNYGPEYAEYFAISYEQNKNLYQKLKEKDRVLNEINTNSHSYNIFLQHKKHFWSSDSTIVNNLHQNSIKKEIKRRIVAKYPKLSRLFLPALKVCYNGAKKCGLI